MSLLSFSLRCYFLRFEKVDTFQIETNNKFRNIIVPQFINENYARELLKNSFIFVYFLLIHYYNYTGQVTQKVVHSRVGVKRTMYQAAGG